MQVIGDGNVTKERIEKLEEMREQLGLGKEAADKVVNGVRNQRLIGDLNVSIESPDLLGALTCVGNTVAPDVYPSRHGPSKHCPSAAMSVSQHDGVHAQKEMHQWIQVDAKYTWQTYPMSCYAVLEQSCLLP